jgi:hypothetical protein
MRRLALIVSAVCGLPSPALADDGPPGAQPPLPAAVSPMPFRHGFTAEVNLGLGFADVSSGGQSQKSDAALAGLDLGFGAWITPTLALTGRLDGVHVHPPNTTDDILQANVDVALQYWVGPHVWIGGGVGLSILQQANNGCSLGDKTSMCRLTGWNLDGRAGYALFRGNHAVDVSVEITPGFYNQNGTSGQVLGVALLLGYQYL